MSDLDPRKQTILHAIIVEYVMTAEPVGSEALVAKYPLGVRSATVRNEMAEMLDLGYLNQPHTSAGRIPSDRGYRYYVDRLVIASELEESVKARVRSAAGEGEALMLVLRDTAKALSQLSQLLGVATTVREMEVTVKMAVLSALGPTQALFVLALSNGHIENRMVECPPGLTLDDVGLANELLKSALLGKKLRSLSKAKAPVSASHPSMDKLIETVWGTVRTVAKEHTRGKLITEGEEFLFSQPEFRNDVAAFTHLLQELSSGELLYEAVAPGDDATPVRIGKENRNEQMHNLSVVRRSFYIGENEAGVIGLVGPTRLRYSDSLPLVTFTANVLSEALTKYLA